jgi:hypothetical protein
MSPLSFVPQLVPGVPLGGVNCTCAAAAMCIRHVLDRARPSAQDVRDLCLEPNGAPNVTGGTNLREVGSAMDRGWGVDLDIRTPIAFDALWERLRDGSEVAILQIRYLELRNTPLYASRRFADINHAILVARDGDHALVYDPLADGRAPTIPRAPVRSSPDVLRRATAQLKFNDSGSRVLGRGLAYAGFVRRIVEEPRVPTHRVRFGPSAFWVYTEGADALSRESKRFQRPPTSAPCGSPRWADFNNTRRRLVRVTAGPLTDRMVEPGRHDVELLALTTVPGPVGGGAQDAGMADVVVEAGDPEDVPEPRDDDVEERLLEGDTPMGPDANG